MNIKEVFDMKRNITLESEVISRKFRELKSKHEELKNNCEHRIVFLIRDNKPHKLNFLIAYCPSCGKFDIIHSGRMIKDTSFEGSEIINLTELRLEDSSLLYSMIDKEVYDRMDFYYDDYIDSFEKSMSMISVLSNEKRLFLNKKEN